MFYLRYKSRSPLTRCVMYFQDWSTRYDNEFHQLRKESHKQNAHTVIELTFMSIHTLK